jgi:hypothetical protein
MLVRKKKRGVRNMKTRIFLGICCIALLIFVMGCAATPVGSVPTGLIYTGTTGPVSIAIGNYPEYRIVGPAKGKSTCIAVLGIIAAGGAGANEAYQDAIKRVQADALVDVRVDQKVTSVLGLFSKHTTIVTGTAIKFVK